MSGSAAAVTSEERAARAVWSGLVEPGDAVAGALVEAVGAAPALDWVRRRVAGSCTSTDGAWEQLEQRGGDLGPHGRRQVERALDRWAPRVARAADTDPASWRSEAERAGARVVVPGDDEWPAGLQGLGLTAPLCLWVRGAAIGPALDRSVALVGARASTSYGDRVAFDLADGLVHREACVVSGGAYGIDAAAHRGALHAGGRTCVVLAGGVDRAYPAGNARLVERTVTDGGAVLAEVPPGAVPTKSRFLQRNRMIAAMASATVVVEAAWRSGALSTAHHAARLLRPVGAVPGPVTSVASVGTHRLLREGVAVCVTDAAEVMELAGLVGTDLAPAHAEDVRAGDLLDPHARAVLDVLSARTPRSADEIAASAGVALSQARGALGLLELDGVVVRVGGLWRRAAVRRP
ncbi:DNA-processing protein DprA [Cellulomonas soli]|uniref:DNA processing protein DprA n=1 Tax=Cellulomonas soli TaxID=931535 RepID=A0A512PBC3_9CELL|nr:DNA-processing protein DprA [Cellulomonas soli]NYI61073.1 DNA processing protein [Cellulomonas soli]GEP68510.1 DNA processing protein DprA [Cellulomonas soli]